MEVSKVLQNRKPRKIFAGFCYSGTSNKLIMISCSSRRRFCSSVRARIGRTRRLPVVIDMIFDLTGDVVLGILELTDAAAEPTHQFGNLLTTEQQEHYECD